MSKLNGNQCIGLSQYYNDEANCPYFEAYETAAWTAEKLVGEKNVKTAPKYLASVVELLVSGNPKDAARYVAEFPFCKMEQKTKVAEKYKIADQVLFEKPKGSTVFEYVWEGTFVPERGGYLLYRDGRVIRMFGCSSPESANAYILVKSDKETAALVKELLDGGAEEIAALPKKVDCIDAMDGDYNFFKFGSKRCGGYMPLFAKEGKGIKKWAKKVAKLLKKSGIELDVE